MVFVIDDIILLLALAAGGFALYEISQNPNLNASNSSNASSGNVQNAGSLSTYPPMLYDPLINLIPKGSDIGNLTNPYGYASSNEATYQNNRNFVNQNSNNLINNASSEIQQQQNNIQAASAAPSLFNNPIIDENNGLVLGVTASGQAALAKIQNEGVVTSGYSSGVPQVSNVMLNQGVYSGPGEYVNKGAPITSASYISSYAQYQNQVANGFLTNSAGQFYAQKSTTVTVPVSGKTSSVVSASNTNEINRYNEVQNIIASGGTPTNLAGLSQAQLNQVNSELGRPTSSLASSIVSSAPKSAAIGSGAPSSNFPHSSGSVPSSSVSQSSSIISSFINSVANAASSSGNSFSNLKSSSQSLNQTITNSTPFFGNLSVQKVSGTAESNSSLFYR